MGRHSLFLPIQNGSSVSIREAWAGTDGCAFLEITPQIIICRCVACPGKDTDRASESNNLPDSIKKKAFTLNLVLTKIRIMKQNETKKQNPP